MCEATHTSRLINFPQMDAYIICIGAKTGWLPAKYFGYAHRMREAAQSKVDEFGQAFYILMEAAGKVE